MQQRTIALFRQLPFLRPALKLVWQAAPRLTLWWAGLLLIQGLLPIATVYLTKEVVDSLAHALDIETRRTLIQALLVIAALAGVLLCVELLRGVTRWVQTAQAEKVTDHVKRLIHDKATSLDLSYYETPDYYDMLHRARNEASTMPLSLVQNLGRLVQNGITLVAMMGILLPFGTWVPFALLMGTLPAALVVMRASRRLHAWRYRRAELQRLAHYYDRTITSQEAAAELRLFSLASVFIERFQTIRQQVRREQLALVRQEVSAELFAALLGLVTIGATLALLTWQTITRGGSFGELALFYQAIRQGQKLASTLLGSVGQIYRNLLFLENLFAFLALEPRLPESVLPSQTSIPFESALELQDVSFSYPGTERATLTNFSLSIPAGKIVAIVGENGAGKSTLIKLLTRLYDPSAGAILLDGTDMRELPLAQLRRLFTVLFQTPIRYELSAYENIAFGDWHAQPDEHQVQTAAEAAGADAPLDKLPQAQQTILSKRFGGAELSVGEWQRIALARAFLRQSPIIILDEPTSAMDSWAEMAWLARFRELARDKTALIVTHRFTTAMQADVIHVMMDGQVVESGTHAELLALKGHYATSWHAQSQQQHAALG